jgi:hypothetical protein
MESNSYSSADVSLNPPKLGQYHDLLGEYEWHDTIYTLLVFTPPRPPPRFLPKFLFRENVPASRIHVIRSAQEEPNYDCFEHQDLEDMKSKWVKIKSYNFPPEMRCKHIYGTNEKKCDHGCYVLEKGGDVKRWTCKNPTCEGHVYVGRRMEQDDGTVCFGKKGERLVCVDISPQDYQKLHLRRDAQAVVGEQ